MIVLHVKSHACGIVLLAPIVTFVTTVTLSRGVSHVKTLIEKIQEVFQIKKILCLNQYAVLSLKMFGRECLGFLVLITI